METPDERTVVYRLAGPSIRWTDTLAGADGSILIYLV